MDIFSDNECIKRLETKRSGIFKLQLGLDSQQIDILLQRVIDAQARFKDSPLAHVATQLEKEVIVSSVFGTNTIEGGELSEQETEAALELTPEQIQTIQQQRALNIKTAYDYIREQADKANWQPNFEDVMAIHKRVYFKLSNSGEQNQPGVLRDNPDGMITKVGDSDHGGIYKPPQLGTDIHHLLSELLQWNQQLVTKGVPALIRAPLIHFYFELIHPFWDGNGRVGRVLEAGILYADGFRYAPFAQARYYLKNIDHYFALFNHCRKAADKKQDYPNTAFIMFFLNGMLDTINALHDRVNRMIHMVLYEARVKLFHDQKKINDRQYAIVNEIVAKGSPTKLKILRQAAWYQAMYSKLTDKTRSRDIRQLFDIGLLMEDKQGNVLPAFMTKID
ncbi:MULTISPECIES: Fic family protein [unclassified Methylophaga]|jgi:Fic family protein|uniref:Fic family protein n=1 Tax=unclassified Methylophaga TaxID=2629249 RepID=UPI00259CED2B|nr:MULTISPECIES: Fic family protein [unclassified Methylophaga]|tara:strand:+ start:18547 stop:19722 length:1176 start_codon:yes stop_codon:yes gene_type:complete